MTCNIVLDFVSPHNGEYWYRCTTCGASDWFGRNTVVDATKPIQDCVEQTVSSLDVRTKRMLVEAYNRGYAAAMEVIAALPKTVPNITVQEVLKNE